ncbi:MAG: hypothetical protein O2820_21250 [Planctomycetota bacterium]|nr:hypothetical protein [Planctomycetota bacterium]MDA1251743.1 hypothetical protein [Planctomycetota bacterium]
MTSKRLVPALLILAVVLPGLAWALGFELGESKEELKLKYDVSVTDPKTGRVTIVVKIEDYGRLKPVYAVDLSIPAKESHNGRGHYMDLVVSMALQKEGDKDVARVHILRELAERASIQLKTGHLDGKQSPLTWYSHSIPIAKYLKESDEKDKK